MFWMFLFLADFGMKSPSLELDLSAHEIFTAPPLAVTENGALVVAHRDEGKLLFFSPDGKLLRKVGTKGQGPGELQRPGEVTWYSREKVLRVTDFRNRRFSEWSEEGKWLRDIPFPPGFFFISGFVNARRLLLVRDPAGHFEGKPGLLSYDFETKEKKPVWEYPLPKAKKVTEASLPGGGQMALLLQWEPKLASAVGSDFIVVSWPEERDLHFFDLEGKRTNGFKVALPRLPVTDEDVEHQLGEVEPEHRAIIREKLVRLEYWPAVGELMVDPKDRIWVLGPERWDGQPCDFKVYDRTGKLLGSGRLDSFPAEITAAAIYLLAEDDDALILKRVPYAF